jgi:hypothetical protein
MKRVLFLLLIFAVSVWSAALAQSNAVATVEVKDATGAVVAGADVTVVTTPSSQNSAVLRTGSNGTVSLDLIPGTYDLSVKMPGFRKVNKQVVITGTKNETFPVELQNGSCTQCVVYGPDATAPYRLDYSEFLKLNGVIADGGTATAVAEAIFNIVFGKEYSAQFVPYHTQFKAGVWTVYGTLPQGSRGGTPMLKIQKSNGKVLKVWHSQ